MRSYCFQSGSCELLSKFVSLTFNTYLCIDIMVVNCFKIFVSLTSKTTLGFENERTRYNNYVWVEVLASKPINEYFKTEYYIN